VVEQIHVEVAVSVVVEERGLRRVSRVLEPVFRGAVGEGTITVVDVEDVAAVHGEVVHRRHVDVEPPIAIDVGHGDAARPARRAGYPCALGDVLELVVALVEIQPVGTEIRSEIKVRQPVTINVPRRDSTAVVVVEVVEDVEVGFFRKRVDEIDAGRLWRQ
jgi:hypothetical protein